jgi:immune inhibitor A
MERKWTLPVILLVSCLVIICCICLCLIAGFAFFGISNSSVNTQAVTELLAQDTPTSTPIVLRPTLMPSPQPAPQTGDPAVLAPTTQTPEENLLQLQDAVVPMNDLYDIARRFEGKDDVPTTLPPPPAPLQVGEQNRFWVSNSDTNQNFQVPATLQYVTNHAYFWIEDGISFRQSELEALAETFESQIYPTDREFFGSEWTPGVDGDPHIYILYARNLGSNIAGLFSSNDSYNPLIQEYSNGHELFLFNADTVQLDERYTYGVLAHEFQHMIHWYRDRNESTWMNEGFADLAMFLNGYDVGGHDFLYVLNPDLQLNDWPNDDSDTTPHYGASFLFLNYFLGRFGEEPTKALVAEPENDLESIDTLLSQMGATDPLTGEAISADDVFADWVVASYLKDSSLGDGRYTYSLYPDAPQASDTEDFSSCDPQQVHTRDVRQYAVDYIRISCNDATTLQFEGSTMVHLLPSDARSGEYAFWSNKGDESDMNLTRTFDFSEYSGPLTLSYWTWFDIEKDFDYVYVMSSEDGENWEMLFPPSGTSEDPTGANYGWGYTGLSGGGPEWIQENVDISQFAGKQVQLRFEYITDASVNGEGLLLDDIAIPEAGYFSDFEQDDGGWEANGFVRIQNLVPQNFRLSLITLGDQIEVKPVHLAEDNTAKISIDLGNSVDEAILVVSGTTRFTRQPATYRFTFLP